MIGAWFFLAGLFAGIGFLGSNWRFAFVPAVASLALALTSGARRRSPRTAKMKTVKFTDTAPARQPAHPEPDVGESGPEGRYETRSFLKSDLAQMGAENGRTEMQAREARRQGLGELEEAIDAAILDGLSLLKQAVEGGHTYAVFFPGKSDNLYLRAWITDSPSLIPGASLHSNQGLVGQLNKDGVRRVLEGDIVVDSTQLHYYARDEGVRSLAGVPIVVKGSRRGAVIVDSLRPAAFDAQTVEKLDALARTVGLMAFYGYMSFEYAIHKEQLAALTSYQRKFLENMSVENIVTQVLQYVGENLEGDRIMVVGREGTGTDDAKVIRCQGLGAEDWEGFAFTLEEKGLVSLVFEKEQVINRSFSGPTRIPRLSPREPGGHMASLLAVPVPTDRGVDMALTVESGRVRRFSEHQQNMLSTIARAAGFALSRARLYQEKEELASLDGLTGVPNHRSFQERFQTETLRAQRYGRQLAILMMDIDYFKKVNDSYGHPAGDQVLREVAAIISVNIRGGIDLLARYGGEEFVCMLSDTDQTRAGETAERIRENVAAKVFESGSTRFHITLSIGGAIYPSDSRHGRELLEKADKALYRAKETGRNRLVFYN